MFLNFILYMFGTFLFLFLLWKRLKDDYSVNQVFGLGFYILLTLFVFGKVSKIFFPAYWFWFGVLGVIIVTLISIWKNKMMMIETVEAVGIALFPMTSFIFLIDAITKSSFVSLGAFFVIFFLLLLFGYFEKNYRKYSWYKSGRVGFSGIVVMGIFFLVRALVSLFGIDVISFFPVYESYISCSFALIFFLVIFRLSRKIF